MHKLESKSKTNNFTVFQNIKLNTAFKFTAYTHWMWNTN